MPSQRRRLLQVSGFGVASSGTLSLRLLPSGGRLYCSPSASVWGSGFLLLSGRSRMESTASSAREE